MKTRRIQDQALNARRGLLLGMTLAEVMLVILFCLLLLLGRHIKELDEQKKELNAYQNLAEELDAYKSKIKEEDLSILYATVRKSSFQPQDSKLPPDWTSLSDAIKTLDENQFNAEQFIETQDHNDQLQKEKKELEDKLKDSRDEKKTLEEKLRAGATPACLYKPPGGYYGGSTLSLGAVYIEEHQMTLINKNLDLKNENPVDYIGNEAKYFPEAYDLLMKFPEDKPLTFDEFGGYAAELKAIGDRETEDKRRCMFTMHWYAEKGTSPQTFQYEFEGYFLQQKEITNEELRAYLDDLSEESYVDGDIWSVDNEEEDEFMGNPIDIVADDEAAEPLKEIKDPDILTAQLAEEKRKADELASQLIKMQAKLDEALEREGSSALSNPEYEEIIDELERNNPVLLKRGPKIYPWKAELGDGVTAICKANFEISNSGLAENINIICDAKKYKKDFAKSFNNYLVNSIFEPPKIINSRDKLMINRFILN